jgi:hypothetical protein
LVSKTWYRHRQIEAKPFVIVQSQSRLQTQIRTPEAKSRPEVRPRLCRQVHAYGIRGAGRSASCKKHCRAPRTAHAAFVMYVFVMCAYMYQVCSSLTRSGGGELRGRHGHPRDMLPGPAAPAPSRRHRPEPGTEPGIHGHEVRVPAASFIWTEPGIHGHEVRAPAASFYHHMCGQQQACTCCCIIYRCLCVQRRRVCSTGPGSITRQNDPGLNNLSARSF